LGLAVGLLVVEVGSFVFLGGYSAVRRGSGFDSNWDQIRKLLPHPAVSKHLDPPGGSPWHPTLGWYRPLLKWGAPRPTPTFARDELRIYLLGGSTVEGDGASGQSTTIAAKL